MESPEPCPECEGTGYYAVRRGDHDVLYDCRKCGGQGWSLVDPHREFPAPPGSARVPWLVARAELGIPLFPPEAG